MDSLDQFLLGVKLELDAAKEEYDRKDFLQPYRYIDYVEFLVPVGLEMPISLATSGLRHFFISETVDLHFYKSAIIHGHAEGKGCAAPKMCHLYGFWPTKDYSPRFKKIFEARWLPIYRTNKWEIPK